MHFPFQLPQVSSVREGRDVEAPARNLHFGAGTAAAPSAAGRGLRSPQRSPKAEGLFGFQKSNVRKCGGGWRNTAGRTPRARVDRGLAACLGIKGHSVR